MIRVTVLPWKTITKAGTQQILKQSAQKQHQESLASKDHREKDALVSILPRLGRNFIASELSK
jgi:hypothetical protein